MSVDMIASAFVGAAIALLLEWLLKHRASQGWTAKRLALAYREELAAVAFNAQRKTWDPENTEMGDGDGFVRHPEIAGFSSQTFDTLFREFAESFPEGLARDLMRYHWKTKFLVEEQDRHYTNLAAHRDSFDEAERARSQLLKRLERYAELGIGRLMLWREEPRS